MSETKRMGSMNKLSDFGRSAEISDQIKEPTAPTTRAKRSGRTNQSISTQETAKNMPTNSKTRSVQIARSIAQQSTDKPVAINIKVPANQQRWLADKAQQVRKNNDLPVAAVDRVYPQHLIQVAIELLQSQDLDWSEVKNTSELRHFLNIIP